MQYIRQLEAEVDRLHKYIQDIAGQLKTSKIANSSLNRQLEKTSGGTSFFRPGTSGITLGGGPGK